MNLEKSVKELRDVIDGKEGLNTLIQAHKKKLEDRFVTRQNKDLSSRQ